MFYRRSDEEILDALIRCFERKLDQDEPRFGFSWNLLSAGMIVEYLKKKRSKQPSNLDEYLQKEIDAITNLADIRRHAEHFRMDPVDMLDKL